MYNAYDMQSLFCSLPHTFNQTSAKFHSKESSHDGHHSKWQCPFKAIPTGHRKVGRRGLFPDVN